MLISLSRLVLPIATVRHPARFVILALILLINMPICPLAAAEPIIVQGSTTMVSRLMEPHRTEIERRAHARLTIIPTKSINGLIALLEGRAALAMISAPLETELQHIRRQHPDTPYDRLRSFEIARTSVAFITHPNNPVKELKLDDLRRILLGQATSWSEFGGAAIPIKPVFVKGGGGVILSIQSQLLGGAALASPNAVPVDTPRQVIKAVAQVPGAIGLAQRQLASASGLPQLETDGTIEQTLNMVSLDSPSEQLARIIDAARNVAAERLF